MRDSELYLCFTLVSGSARTFCEMVLQRYVATVPIDVVMSAIQELDEGSRCFVETCIRSNQAESLTAGEEVAVM